MTDPGPADKDAGTGGDEDCTTRAAADRNLGVLLVHGMGEQKPGDHVEKVVRSLVASWGADYEVREVCQEPECRRPADPAGPDGTGDGTEVRAAEDSPRIVVRVLVGGNQNETVDLHFHEVWWADLGVRTGLRNWGRFLWWVVRAPFRRLRAGTGEFDDTRWMNRARSGGLVELESPRSGMRGLLQFFVLCCFSGLAILVACTWGLLRRVLRGFAPSPVALLQSFGDVQIYTEGARADTGSGPDMGLPPRVPIRRRMVQKMVAMAECGCYDRWYVMAHSLGSVVAFNGLMEPDYILPNYLEKAQWDRLHKRFKTQRRDNDTEKMRPRRPAWLKPTDALSRQELFGGLGGLVTYGSPLHLFVDLWPHIVLLNKNDVFAKDFRWLNVCSPFDPISGALRAIRGNDEGADAKLRPEVLRFSGNRWVFIAHGAYLKGRRARQDVGHYLGKWWLRREDFSFPRGVQWPAWLVALSQILLASAGLVVLFLGEALAVVTSVRRLWDALLVGLAEMCCIATLTAF